MRILYLIADLYDGDGAVREALEAGVDYVQLREKNITSAKYLEDAMHMRKLTDYYNEKYSRDTKFIVNDRIDIALLSCADGVHLGADDVPVSMARKMFDGLAGTGNRTEGKQRGSFIIGATAKTVEQAVAAQHDGADYIGTGAFNMTATKPDAKAITPELYKQILAAVSIPDVAVGGITVDNCRIPLSCGADGLAVSAGILKSSDVKKSVIDFRKILNSESTAQQL
ncbi:MAG: thiamine phosphate synthase [Clostridia bacterium]|nr:thiamine phosphate synthase [Clostridia bacterium]